MPLGEFPDVPATRLLDELTEDLVALSSVLPSFVASSSVGSY